MAQWQQCNDKSQSYPRNRLWRPIGLWDVKAPTLFRQSAHGWWWGCQPYAPASHPLPPGRLLVLISVKRPSRLQDHSAAGRIRSTEKSNDLIGNQTRNFPACNTVPQCTHHNLITPLSVVTLSVCVYCADFSYNQPGVQAFLCANG
jgi:ssDNA-binding Zn-finger/Zn-ribbon topoisomerase 1